MKISKILMHKFTSIQFLFLASILTFLTYNNLFSETKEKLFENLKSKFSGLESISVNFQSIEDKSFKGSLITTKDNNYKLTFPERIITCDGETVWNYNMKEKQVIISKFQKTSAASLQTIFFEITNNFVPSDLKETISTKKGKSQQLTLLNPNNHSEKLILILNSKLEIQQIIFNYQNSTGNFLLQNFKINPKLSSSQFKFKIPKGVEELDLR